MWLSSQEGERFVLAVLGEDLVPKWDLSQSWKDR